MSETIDKIIYEAFGEYWKGLEATKNIESMRKQLHKNLTDQINGYWSGSSAYRIMTKGGFLISAGQSTYKELTILGEKFMQEYEEPKSLETIGYYLCVSNIWQKTTKDAYDDISDMGMPKVKVNLEYWEESMEILNSSRIPMAEAIKEVEDYLDDCSSKKDDKTKRIMCGTRKQ